MAADAPSAAPARLDALWTSEDVAAYLRVSLSMVYKLRREGTLHASAIGKLFRFDPEHVRAYARGEPIQARRSPARVA